MSTPVSRAQAEIKLAYAIYFKRALPPIGPRVSLFAAADKNKPPRRRLPRQGNMIAFDDSHFFALMARRAAKRCHRL